MWISGVLDYKVQLTNSALVEIKQILWTSVHEKSPPPNQVSSVVVPGERVPRSLQDRSLECSRVSATFPKTRA